MIVLNVCLIVLFSIGFSMIARRCTTQLFFDISYLHRLIILHIPISLSIINLIALLFLSDYSLLWVFIPLSIPLSYFIYSWWNDYFGERQFHNMVSLTLPLLEMAQDEQLNLLKDDLIVRIKNRKRVDIIINVYSTEDEAKIKTLRGDMIEQMRKSRPNHHFEVLIDKKKETARTG